MLKGFVHRALCSFGRHKWEQVPEVREADTPWLRTNAQCQRCLVRGEINWLSEEEAEEAKAILMDLQREAQDSQWR